MLANEFNSKSNTKFATKIVKNQVAASADHQSSSKRTKCKENRNKQQQLSKRKRRRRRSPTNTTTSAIPQPYNVVVETMANIEVQPLVLVSNKRQIFKETIQKSSTNAMLDNGQHEDRSNNEVFDIEHNVHVRHAMLWIKVDVNKNMARKHMKLAKKQRPKLWVFRINEQSSNKVSFLR